MSTPLPSKHTNTLKTLGFLIILCLVILLSYFWSQTKVADKRLLEQRFTLSLTNLSQRIDARIASMQLIAKMIANDSHIHQWVNEDFDGKGEAILVNKLQYLVDEYELTSASFADKKTHKYWNHEGFLRVLQPEIDTWYFAYLASGEPNLVSVYHDKNKKRVDVYVNYQQPDSNGLSGIATSFDGVLDMLNTSIFAKNGQVYLVDGSGKIQVHADLNVAGTKNLYDQYDKNVVDKLLNKTNTQMLNIPQGKDRWIGASYIPSMNWYVVAHIGKEKR